MAVGGGGARIIEHAPLIVGCGLSLTDGVKGPCSKDHGEVGLSVV